MREIADEVGAYLFVDMAHVASLIAAVFIEPIRICSRCHHNNRKTLAESRGWFDFS